MLPKQRCILSVVTGLSLGFTSLFAETPGDSIKYHYPPLTIIGTRYAEPWIQVPLSLSYIRQSDLHASACDRRFFRVCSGGADLHSGFRGSFGGLSQEVEAVAGGMPPVGRQTPGVASGQALHSNVGRQPSRSWRPRSFPRRSGVRGSPDRFPGKSCWRTRTKSPITSARAHIPTTLVEGKSV